MKKVALFAFRGEMSCFVHVLLNALDFREKGYEVNVVLEGEATRLVAELAKPDNHLHGLFEKTKSLGLFAGVCRACSHQLGSQEAAVAEGFTLLDDMHGHPGMAPYVDNGCTVLVF
ncbi:MAG: cytoplasmic protein [Solidesulfovibrio sp. DCME]|uniref:cytoplasmic protein n=1 Tax=Solidesulfovibrio sp. DCME TaxID=3447380 RepID=UPI003D09B1A1